jgi:uncharacterized protein with ParB-like and HNH nuclease domain
MRRTNGLEGQLSLFDENRNPRPEHTLRRINTSRSIKIPLSDKDDEIKLWEERTKIALTRFPELDRGERITTEEINEKLDELARTDYPIPKYNRNSNREAWNCCMVVRKDIRFQGLKYCPQTVRLILAQNMRKREEAKNPFLR